MHLIFGQRPIGRRPTIPIGVADQHVVRSRRSGEWRTPGTILSSGSDREGLPVTPSVNGGKGQCRRRRDQHQGAARQGGRMFSFLRGGHMYSLLQGGRQFAPLPGVGDGVAGNVVAPTATVPTPPCGDVDGATSTTQECGSLRRRPCLEAVRERVEWNDFTREEGRKDGPREKPLVPSQDNTQR